jgi:predicted alpha/beta-hydrolase family hydrolase
VKGFLHQPQQPNGDALVLTHGAGANCQSKLLMAVAAGLPMPDSRYCAATCRFGNHVRMARRFLPVPRMIARGCAGLSRRCARGSLGASFWADTLTADAKPPCWLQKSRI